MSRVTENLIKNGIIKKRINKYQNMKRKVTDELWWKHRLRRDAFKEVHLDEHLKKMIKKRKELAQHTMYHWMDVAGVYTYWGKQKLAAKFAKKWIAKIGFVVVYDYHLYECRSCRSSFNLPDPCPEDCGEWRQHYKGYNRNNRWLFKP